MPQKKSSQLYSVSPKRLVKTPPKKRSRQNRFVLPIILGATIFILLTIFGGYYLLTRSTIVSPLPVGLGALLPVPKEKDDQELTRLLQKHHIMYTGVSHTGEDYIVTVNSKQQIFLTHKKDLAQQISSLQIILPRLTMEGREFRTLDLRYNKAVVSY